MLNKVGRRLRRLTEWLSADFGGIMDELTVSTALWIFSTVAVLVFAGLLWGAMSPDVQALVGVLKNLF